jgi:hypothetical protein
MRGLSVERVTLYEDVLGELLDVKVVCIVLSFPNLGYYYPLVPLSLCEATSRGSLCYKERLN